MRRDGFVLTLPVLSPLVRRWVGLGLGAAAVAAASGVLFYAFHFDVERPAHAGAAVEHTLRRRARPELGRPQVQLPLERVSRVHVAVRVHGTIETAGKSRQQVQALRVVLDTGTSSAFGTAHFAHRHPLRTAPHSLVARSFHGEAAALYPLEQGEQLVLSTSPDGSPHAVRTSVSYLAPATLYEADVIAPPQLFAPIGGAVLLDLARDIFAICESVRDCGVDPTWTAVGGETCGRIPELVGVRADVGGRAAHLLLDTGAPTLFFENFYEQRGLRVGERRRELGSLTGISGAAPGAALVVGDWLLRLDERVSRSLPRLWVVPASPSGLAHCFGDGSLGLDALEDCRIVLQEGNPGRGFIRCE